jgi:hypothetical protein
MLLTDNKIENRNCSNGDLLCFGSDMPRTSIAPVPPPAVSSFKFFGAWIFLTFDANNLKDFGGILLSPT